jgi:hypothetical protein
MADAVGLFKLFGLGAVVILVIWFVYAIGRFVWSRLVERPSTRRDRRQPRLGRPSTRKHLRQPRSREAGGPGQP